MGFRTVVIRKPCKLSYKNECLIIRSEESLVVHLSEIHTLLIDSTMVTLTAYLLCALLEHKVKVIICDERRNPMGEIVPYYGCHNASGQLKQQLLWPDQQKALVWQGIIRQKIRGQALLLKSEYPFEAELLEEYARQVLPQDKTNREGHAAKVYFNRIFGDGFSRSLKSETNSALDYGYALLLSSMNKELNARGYLTQLGIQHRNEYNHFNLSSDLMEPFRPLVDHLVLQRAGYPFDKEMKAHLLGIFRSHLRYRGKTSYFGDCMARYVSAVTRALCGDISIEEALFCVLEDESNADFGYV